MCEYIYLMLNHSVYLILTNDHYCIYVYIRVYRSGHRMIVWRNYIVLFGGFFETVREVTVYKFTV